MPGCAASCPRRSERRERRATLDPARWQRVRERFESIRDRGGAEKAQALDELEARDPDLAREVRRLLAADRPEGEGEFALSGGLLGPLTGEQELRGTRLGSYHLLRRIATGGMGAVYEARREGPVDQRVAVKVLRSVLVSEEERRRFLREGQLLARLGHARIASLYDAGVARTEAGEEVPFLVMEYVDGEPVDEYCVAHRLPARRRLALFEEICDAVQYAHQNLVVHRDLKPGNILVGEGGVPKLLDFGIAKILEEDEAWTRLTADGMRLLTPLYASPEQIRGDPVTTRSDVYSLGVLLFELLTGGLPYGDVASPTALSRAICEVPPLRPSARAAGLSADLDAVVLKALRKEPERRYGSAAELAEELGRYRRGLPVRARPDTAAYRARKFFRRHPFATSVTLLSSTAILVLAVVSTVLYLRSERARIAEQNAKIAEQQARSSEQTALRLARSRLEEATLQKSIVDAVNQFFNEEILLGAHPDRARNKEVTMQEVLDRASERIEGRFDDAPLVEAAIRFSLGSTYLAYGQGEDAEPHLRRALELREEHLGMESLETFAAQRDLASALEDQGRIQEALELNENLLERQIEALGEADGYTHVTMSNIALNLQSLGDLEEAGSIFSELLEIRRRTLGEEHVSTLTTLANLGGNYLARGKLAEAEEILEEAYRMRRKTLGPDHRSTLVSQGNLATVRARLGDVEGAIAAYEEVLAGQIRVLGEQHRYTQITRQHLESLHRRRAEEESD